MLNESHRMYRLMAFLSSHDEDATDSAGESHPLQELHPIHTYPPVIQPASSCVTIRTYPLEPTSLGEDFTMAEYEYNPWGTNRRMREEDDQCVSFFIPFLTSQLMCI